MSNNNVWDYDLYDVDNILKQISDHNILDPESKEHHDFIQKIQKLITDYIEDSKCAEALKPQHKKIIAICDWLVNLPKDKEILASKTAKDRLNEIAKTLLFGIKTEEKTPIEKEEPFYELEEMILDNVFLPDIQEKILSEAEAPPEKEALSVDPRSDSYSFEHVETLDYPSNKLLFHIHADEFGSSSSLEGGKSKDAVDYLLSYLKEANQIKSASQTLYSSELIEELDHAVSFDPWDAISGSVGKVREKINEAFQSGKPLLLMGGWLGEPTGHAIYYEIIPGSDQKTVFRLYNTGAGLDVHNRVTEGNKVKYQTYSEWKGIDREKLESPYFLEALCELKSYDALAHKPDYEKKDVYQGLRTLLQPQEEVVDVAFKVDKHLMMSPQRAGVCSWKSLMAFVRTKMDLNDYKRFKVDVKLQSLTDYVKLHSENGSEVTPQEWRLVQKSHQNLCRAIVTLYQKQLVGDAYIQAAQKALKPVSQWIHEHADCRYKREPEKISFTYEACSKGSMLENKHSLSQPLNTVGKSIKAADVPTQPCLYILDTFKQINSHTPASVDKDLESVISLSRQAWTAREDIALHKGLIHFVSGLELDKEFWEKAIMADPQKAEALIVQLGEVSQMFMKSCFAVPEAHLIFPEKAYVFHKILHIQGLLCRLGHPNSLFRNIYPETDCINVLRNEITFRLPDAKMHREMEVMARLEAQNRDNRDRIEMFRYGYNELKNSDQVVGMKLKFERSDREDPEFVDLIRKEYPSVVESIAKEEEIFRKLPKFSQDAHIYASYYLPDWIKAMRDTQLSSLHLEQSYIGSLATLDRESDIKQIFHVKDIRDSSLVTVGLAGVNSDIFKIPELNRLNKIRGNRELVRHVCQYQEVTAKPMRIFAYNVLSYLTDNHLTRGEKESFQSTSAKRQGIDWPDEEYKELLRLFLGDKLQHIEVLEYFTKYPEKLKDPDYQILLQILLFEGGILDQSLKIEGFAERLEQFVQHHYEKYKEENEISVSVFLLKIAHQLNGFLPEQKFFQNTSEKLQGLANRKGMESEIKRAVYSELIVQLGDLDWLNEEEVAVLLEGVVYLEEIPSEGKEDPYTANKIREALQIHAQRIREVLEQGMPNQVLLNRLLKGIRPREKEGKQWLMQTKLGEFPVFSTADGKHTFYPLLSKLISSREQTIIPSSIRQNPLFGQLFPTVERGMYHLGNIFSFEDALGHETLVHMKNDCLIIEQKLEDDKWYRYVPAESFLDKATRSLIGSRYLVHHYTHWQSLEDDKEQTGKIYARDPKTGQKKYLITVERKDDSHFEVNEVSDLSHGLRLGKPSTLLSSFEDTAYIHEWYDDQDILKKIELPRFHLSFKPDPKNSEKFSCDQFPGYMLNRTDAVKSLGVFQHFILLENAHGQQKVILPQQLFKPPEKKEVLLPSYELERELKRENVDAQKYIVFDVQKNGKLFSKMREANLYLSQVLGIAQEYKRSAYYLKKYGMKLSAYAPKEEQALRNITKISNVTGDISGNGVALQLYASYLLIKNIRSHHQEASQEDRDILKLHYDRYINHYRNATVFKLTPEEEIYVIKMLLAKTFDPIYFIRLKELDPASARELKVPDIKDFKGNPAEDKPKIRCDFTIPDEFNWELSFRKPVTMLLTRPQGEKHFGYFYEIARKGSDDEKQRLKASLPFLRIVQAGRHEGMANFFEAVLASPTAFPDPVMSKEWKNKVQEIAEAQFIEGLIPLTESIKGVYHGDMTNGDFRLERSPTVREVKVEYVLPSLPTFNEACKAANCFQEVSGKSGSKKVEALSSLLKTCVSDDPVQNKEVSRLLDDVSVYQGRPTPSTYTADERGLIAVEHLLSQDKLKDQEKTSQLEKDILALANKSPDSHVEVVHRQLKKWGGLHKVITLEELIVDFARTDYNVLLQRNPALTNADMNQLVEMVGTFLLYATRDQQRTRAEALLSNLKPLIADKEKDLQEYNDLVNQLAQVMQAPRAYNPIERPAYLVFDYLANLSMRPEQVNKLESFLKKGDLNPVMEMIMGSGKSKVLLPLLGLMRADGKALSMVIVPKPLFESVSQDTQSILYGFSQSLRSLQFERHTKFTKQSLESILDELTSIRKNKECLMMTSKSVQCLVLKFIEACSTHFDGPNKEKEFPEELKIMRKILTLLSESGYPIIDEADSVLNVLHEVSFSGGSRVSPKSYELEVLSELYGLLYENDSLRNLAHLDGEFTEQLTEQLYDEKVRTPLASALIDRLGQMTFSSKSLTDKVHTFIKNLDDKSRTDLMHYLCRDKAHIGVAQKYYDSLDGDLQNIIALAGEQISHLLPYTLTRICNEKYGVDREFEGIFAIPFSAANTPTAGSQFANPYITMNYTVQAYMKQGVTAEMIEAQVKLLQGQAMREMADGGENRLPGDTSAGKAFAKLKGDLDIPLFNYKSCHIEDIVKRINGSSAAKREFVTSIILPQLEQFENKMSCNSQNLVALFGKITGFTGTLWNGLSMHHKLKPEPEVGTDAKTLALLQANSGDNAISIKEGSTQLMLKQLKEQAITYDMISDAGGYFKEGSNAEIAHAVAAMNGKEVVFYNKQNEQTISEGANDIPLDQSNKQAKERLTFLDQAHTTGADVPQKRDAVSLVTIGRNMLLRDLLQSVWRLRGLDKSQRVRFLVSDEVAGIIRQNLKLGTDHPIQLDTILKFVIMNQSAQQGRDNYKALKQELANLPQQMLMQVLLNEKLTPQERLQAFKHLRAQWIKPALFSPKELYGTLVQDLEGVKVLEQDKKQCVDKIEEIFKKMPWLEKMGISQKHCLREVDGIVDRIKDSLPAHLQVPSKEIEDDQTVEVEKEVKQETEVETETEMETELEIQGLTQGEYELAYVRSEEMQNYDSFAEARKALQDLGSLKRPVRSLKFYREGGRDEASYASNEEVRKAWQDLSSLKCPVFSLKSYLESDEALSSYASAFDGIDVSMNTLEWTLQKDKFALLGAFRVDFHHLLVEGSKVTLMTQYEAKHRVDGPDYYNLTLGYNDPHKKPGADVLLKVVKLKFLNGESQFTKVEIKLLEQWFKEQGTAKMQKLYMEHILAGYPQKAKRYLNSPLQRLFAKGV